jgi:tRNA (guanine-N7-)-methyltransferase
MRKKIQKKINFFKYLNCFQANENQILKEKKLFHQVQPIILELGCGKATFSIELAKQNPDKNFIAIDTKINRLADGAKIASEFNLKNIIFVQMHLEQILLHFEPHQIDTIWITFPDPYPKDRHEKHRLTNKKFLAYYHQLLKPNGKIFFKTDNTELFQYTLNILNEIQWIPENFTTDLYASALLNSENCIPTEYEKKFLLEGKKICYLELNNSKAITELLPLEPVPVFSPLKKWIPKPELWDWEVFKPYQKYQDLIAFEEYDINMQFARNQDFSKYFWIIVKGEVRVEFQANGNSQQIAFHTGDIIDLENTNKVYGITISRVQLVKIPKEIKKT